MGTMATVVSIIANIILLIVTLIQRIMIVSMAKLLAEGKPFTEETARASVKDVLERDAGKIIEKITRV